MNSRALVLRILKVSAMVLTTISVLIAAITISFRNNPTDDTKQRSVWSAVIAVSASSQIILTIVGAVWVAAVAPSAHSSLFKVILLNSASAIFALIYAGLLASGRDGVALGAFAVIITVTYTILKAVRMSV